jgi:hypothetical protein
VTDTRRHKGPGRDSTSAKAIATADRHAEWIQARRRGKSYRAIAAESGVAHSTVEEAVAKALKAIRVEPAEELRALELESLDELIEKAWDAVCDGELERLEELRKLRGDRRKFLGLDAPAKTMDVTPPREQTVERVRGLLMNPTEEFAALLAETGWKR